MQQMEALGEAMPVQERLAKIFGNEAATSQEAHLVTSAGNISFSLGETDKKIIPITLAVKRK